MSLSRPVRTREPLELVIAVGKVQARKTCRGWVKERNRRARKRAKEKRPALFICAATGKVRHKNADYALKALARIVGHHPGCNRECRYYWCSSCHGYHLTSQLHYKGSRNKHEK